MPRCRFVQPVTKRLYFADVHKRKLDALRKQKEPRPARLDEIEVAELAVLEAEEDALYLDVKASLSAGERNDMFGDMAKGGEVVAGEKARIDLAKARFVRPLAYIVGWNLIDPQGKPVPVSIEALRGIDNETHEEIQELIDWHEEELVKAQEARKNVRAGAKEPPATSISPSVADGLLTTSAH